MQRSTFLRAGLGTLAASAISPVAWAQPAAWPNKPVRLVVGYPPGGTTDVVARLLATGLSDKLGQPFIVDNRAGASGMIGADAVAKSAPDGYNLLFTASNIATYSALYKRVPFDLEKDLSPVGMVATTPYVMVVHPSLPVRTVAELADYVRAHPGKVNYAASTPGGGQQLGWEIFKRSTRGEMVYVPYKGTGALLPDLLSGTLQAAIDNVAVLTPHIRSGALRALAVTDRKRSPLLPDVPTASEAGLQDFEILGWFGVLAPARTPLPIQQKLAAAITEVINSKAMRERLLDIGGEPHAADAEAFRTFLASEGRRWGGLIKDLGISLQ